MNSTGKDLNRVRLIVRGAVQGVGFRPFVYRLAGALGLSGWVSNTSHGVVIELEGERLQVDRFLLRLEREKPSLASIQSLETVWLAPTGGHSFEIRDSDCSGTKEALILPDIATCPECLNELLDPGNRRFGYPFTNCTNCGPRFSIIEALPYDRPNTSMRGFVMCKDCADEYHDPGNRRFHAQPNACPVCGPQVAWWDRAGVTLCAQGEAIEAAAAAIRDGATVAVKGIGGFHLVCAAGGQSALLRLRAAKNREEKPLAVMVPSIEMALRVCEISDHERRLLTSAAAPIVLLRRRAGESLVAPEVAPGNPLLGVMLPYSPLHHLLLARLSIPVVATSGNRTDEPICIDELEALSRLRGIADFFLVHNRPIVRSVDDSVVRMMAGRELVLRRSRGYAPLPVAAWDSSSPTLAVGAHLKNTIALACGRSVLLSQHVGDLETDPALGAFQKTIADFQRLHESPPVVIASDAHPDYLSTKAAGAMAEQSGAALIRVQHHHAHALSCMAENEVAPPALGVVWDGTGYGLDGTVWGGEFLAVNRGGFARLAHLRTFPLPGGEVAIREPRRAALGLLYEVFGDEVFSMHELPTLRSFSPEELGILRTVLRSAINCPRTSSAGRLFDAVASILGRRQISSFEGQAAMELEWIAGPADRGGALNAPAMPMMRRSAEGPAIIDWEAFLLALVAGVRAGVSAGELSAQFHAVLAHTICDVARVFGYRKVVLSGGCFQNELLSATTIRHLQLAGLDPVWHQRVPPNDGGIALGQVWATLAR